MLAVGGRMHDPAGRILGLCGQTILHARVPSRLVPQTWYHGVSRASSSKLKTGANGPGR